MFKTMTSFFYVSLNIFSYLAVSQVIVYILVIEQFFDLSNNGHYGKLNSSYFRFIVEFDLPGLFRWSGLLLVRSRFERGMLATT